jgi:curved DNA-binding protein CbpA/CheY-like chemotaxis protein
VTRPRILLVEHDVPMRALAARVLDEREFTVIEADEANSALSIFEVAPPALVIVDEALPWVGGLDLCARIRSTGSSVPIVLVSGGPTHAALLNEARHVYGIQHVLFRPFTEETLLQTVMEALGWVRASPSGPPQQGGRRFSMAQRVDTQMLLLDEQAPVKHRGEIDFQVDEDDGLSESSLFADVGPADAGALMAEVELREDIPEPLVPDLQAPQPTPSSFSLETFGLTSVEQSSAPTYRLTPLTSDDPAAPRGIYGEVEFGALLYAAFRDIFTGRLQVRRASIIRTILLRNGHPVRVVSNVRSEQIGWRLALEGRLEGHALARFRTLTEKGLPERDAVLELGVLEPSALAEFEALSAREAIIQCFDWDRGEYGLAYDQDVARTNDAEMNPFVLIFEGTKRFFPVQPLVAHFDRLMARCPAPTEKLRDYGRLLRAFSEELRIVEACDGASNLGEVLGRSPYGLTETLRILLALETVQCLEYRDAPVRDRDWNTGPRTAIGTSPPTGPTPSGSAPRPLRPSLSPRAAPPSSPPAPISARTSENRLGPSAGATPSSGFRAATTGTHAVETSSARSTANVADDAMRAVVLDRFGRLGTATYYELLEVQPEATVEQIKLAFARVARAVHPDRLTSTNDNDLKQKAIEVHKRLNLAWETLADPTKRQEYDALHGALPKHDGKADLVKAESNFHKGRACLARGENKRARDFFDVAVRQDPHTPTYRMHLGWTRFLCAEATDARVRNEAREEIKAALTQDDRVEAGYVFLGIISRLQGNEDLAERFFRKTLSLNSSNADALRELRLIDARKKGGAKDGVFGKLFSKK